MSQYLKRKAKEAAEKVVVLEVGVAVELPLPEEVKEMAAEFTHTALDVYAINGGSNYNLVRIEFNPETMEARVAETYTCPRSVGIQHDNQKRALATLRKIKKDMK